MCCQICYEWAKGSMSNKEALANIGEMIDANQDNEEQVKHLFELAGKVLTKEIPFDEWDNTDTTGILDELDKAFGPEED